MTARIGLGRLLWLAVLIAAAAGIGWVAFRQAAYGLLPGGSPALAQLAPGDARGVLDRQLLALAVRKTAPTPADYAAVAAAARDLPLDARPAVMFAVRALSAGDDGRVALPLLEEARQRDPRLRLTRLFLLDRYLRAGRNDAAAAEMIVLARLLPDTASSLLTNQLADLAQVPATRAGVRTVLARDRRLFDTVLATMAERGADPAALLRFAGRGAPAGLGPEGWRTRLIEAQVKAGRYDVARRFWNDAYRVAPAARGGIVFNPEFRKIVAGPPFDWTLVADPTGSAERGEAGLAVYYYGRRDGMLAQQLLLMPPGTYQLVFQVDGGGNDGDSNLGWSFTCAGAKDDKPFAQLMFPRLAQVVHRVAGDFTVPAGCDAQLLQLRGIAGEFAATVTARVARLTIAPRS